jgi:hypothetical protein
MRSPLKQGRQVIVPALIANILVADTNRLNIHNKTGSLHH